MNRMDNIIIATAGAFIAVMLMIVVSAWVVMPTYWGVMNKTASHINSVFGVSSEKQMDLRWIDKEYIEGLYAYVPYPVLGMLLLSIIVYGYVERKRVKEKKMREFYYTTAGQNPYAQGGFNEKSS